MERLESTLGVILAVSLRAECFIFQIRRCFWPFVLRPFVLKPISMQMKQATRLGST